jgi:hypothetical protein
VRDRCAQMHLRFSHEKKNEREREREGGGREKGGRTGGVLAKNLGQHKRRDEPRRTYSEHGLVGKGVHLNLCVCVCCESQQHKRESTDRSKAYLPQDDHHKEVEGNAEEVHDRGACALLHVQSPEARGERRVLHDCLKRGEERTGMCVPLSVPKQGK